MAIEKKKVLFVCTHNSARSQIAEGWLRTLYGDRYDAYSAGVEPQQVHEYAIQVMGEVGVDISFHRSKSIDELPPVDFDFIVTVCDNAKEACPYFPGAARRLHQGFVDPAGIDGPEQERLDAFRKSRDEIRVWLEGVFGKNGG
jgi:arsenate reductase (thioredoxin)